MKLLSIVFISLIPVLAAPAWVVAAEPASVDLRPRFEVGREDRFSVDMSSTREAKYVESPAQRPESYHQVIRLKRRIVEAGDKGATIELTYEAVAVAIEAGARAVSYDSEGINDSEAELTLAPVVKPTLNKPFTVKVDPYGRFLSVTGNQNDPSSQPSLSLLGEDMFKLTLTPLYGLAKEPSVTKVGETWTESRKSPQTQTGVITTTREYKLTEADSKDAKVAIGGGLSMEFSSKATEAKTRLDKQKVEGQIDWDNQAGTLRDFTYTQSMKLLAEPDGHLRFATTDYTLIIRRIDVWPPVPAEPQK